MPGRHSCACSIESTLPTNRDRVPAASYTAQWRAVSRRANTKQPGGLDESSQRGARRPTLLCAALAAVATPAISQDKIDKPVKILVRFAAGGTADLIARVVADKMKDTWASR
jgi:hypothetical protein